MDERGFKGKTVIVTGSATGIGAAVAHKFGLEGANIVVNFSRSETEARAVVAAIEAAGGRAIAIQGDVASDADCRKIAAAAIEAFGTIDILVNNAGITKFAAHSDLDALSQADFQRLYAVNVIGAFQMVRAAAAPLKASGHGTVVNVSSIAGTFGIGSSIAYAASKGALNTMTQSLARALAPHVRVNAVCPGFVASSWFSSFGDETAARLADEHARTLPLKRVATPEDIADTVAFFAGPASRHVTGEMLLADGGLHLNVGQTSFR
jgi:Dehydrogenases with different specificities (related to short-chain alcohol dehydrogenases)